MEFNQSKLVYHTALDAVLLVGYKPNSDLQMELFKRGIFGICFKEDVDVLKPISKEEILLNNSTDYVSQLPVCWN